MAESFEFLDNRAPGISGGADNGKHRVSSPHLEFHGRQHYQLWQARKIPFMRRGRCGYARPTRERTPGVKARGERNDPSVSRGPPGEAAHAVGGGRPYCGDAARVRPEERGARNARARGGERAARCRHVPAQACGRDGRRRGRPGHRNAGAGGAFLSRPDQRLVHHGRRDRHCLARHLPAASRSRPRIRRWKGADRGDHFLSGRPRGARRRRLSRQWALALRQRHRSCGVGRRRHGGRRHRSRKRRPAAGHLHQLPETRTSRSTTIGAAWSACAAPARAIFRSRIITCRRR